MRGVKKGTKRGPYKKTIQNKEEKDINEEGLSYAEIATILGTTSTEIRKIEAQALIKLRKPTPQNRKLFDYSNI